MEEEKAAWWN